MQKGKKDWIKKDNTETPTRTITGISSKWNDWLHLLNEPLSLSTIRQRRNLLLISVISWLIWYGQIDISSLNMMGIKITNSKKELIYLLALLVHGYFLLSFLVILVGDFIDKNINRYKAIIKSNYWPCNEEKELNNLKLKNKIYMDIILLILKTKDYTIHDTENRIEKLVKDIDIKIEDKIWEHESNSYEKDEYEDSLINQLQKSEKFVWIKLFWNYFLPVLIGIYSFIKLSIVYYQLNIS